MSVNTEVPEHELFEAALSLFDEEGDTFMSSSLTEGNTFHVLTRNLANECSSFAPGDISVPVSLRRFIEGIDNAVYTPEDFRAKARGIIAAYEGGSFLLYQLKEVKIGGKPRLCLNRWRLRPNNDAIADGDMSNWKPYKMIDHDICDAVVEGLGFSSKRELEIMLPEKHNDVRSLEGAGLVEQNVFPVAHRISSENLVSIALPEQIYRTTSKINDFG